MEYVQLGKSDLWVSRVGFGCEQLGGCDWGVFDEESAIGAVRKALDYGINFFDTADVYGLGRSEEVLCKALGSRSKDVVVATKFGVNWQEQSDGRRARTFLDSSPRRVVEALEASLRRLKLESISLYQIHWLDPCTPLDDTLNALIKCRTDGKIRHIGCSNFPLAPLLQASQICDLTSVQIPHSLVDRQVAQEVLPLCKELNIGVLAYGVLAQGLLTGKYSADTCFGENDRRSRLKIFQGDAYIENLQLVKRLKAVGERYDKTPAQVAMRWVLDQEVVSSVIIGAKNAGQVEQNVGALNWNLQQRDMEYLVS